MNEREERERERRARMREREREGRREGWRKRGKDWERGKISVLLFHKFC